MDWLTILPQVITIGLVIWRKEIILALVAGIFTSELLIILFDGGTSLGMSFINTVERMVAVFSSPGNTRLLMFSLIIGVLVAYIRHSGGVTALVELLVKKGVTKTKKQVGFLTLFTGVILFMETSLSMLTTGILSRGLFDRFGMSRERLAYIVDVTCSPSAVLFLLFNGWGAFVLLNLNASGLENPLAAVIGSVGYNFYAWVAILIVVYTIVTDKIHGPMKEFEAKSAEEATRKSQFPATKARYMIVPILVMILGIFGFLYWTGDGVISSGDGSKAILYSTILACLTAYIMMLSSGGFGHIELVNIAFKGMHDLLLLVAIILLALAFGASLKILGTGEFVANLASENLPMIMIVPMLFVAASIVAFSTGTSYGTIALFIPIGVPLIQLLGLPPSFVLSAILGGAVFGDHCSPISDSTVLSSVAAGCDVLDHVKTQLPYALTGAGISFILYIVVGFFII